MDHRRIAIPKCQHTVSRRVATCKPGKFGVTSFFDTLALFFIRLFLSFRKMKVQDRQKKPPRAYQKKHSKTSFEKNCSSAWASTLNMGLINKVDMVCLSPVGYGV